MTDHNQPWEWNFPDDCNVMLVNGPNNNTNYGNTLV